MHKTLFTLPAETRPPTAAQAVVAAISAASLLAALDVEIRLEINSDDAVELAAIWSHGKRGVGRASQALRLLCETADAYGVSIHAFVQPLHYRDDKGRFAADPHRLEALDADAPDACHLQAWYAKFGFINKPGSDRLNPDMVRFAVGTRNRSVAPAARLSPPVQNAVRRSSAAASVPSSR